MPALVAAAAPDPNTPLCANTPVEYPSPETFATLGPFSIISYSDNPAPTAAKPVLQFHTPCDPVVTLAVEPPCAFAASNASPNELYASPLKIYFPSTNDIWDVIESAPAPAPAPVPAPAPAPPLGPVYLMASLPSLNNCQLSGLNTSPVNIFSLAQLNACDVIFP